MARATLHHFTRDTNAWKDAGTNNIHVWPALWVLVSAFATKRTQGRPSVLTTATETALLLQHVNHGHGHPLTWTRAALTAPPHLRRFLTESAALALTLQMAHESGWDPLAHGLLNVDDLPQPMRWLSPDNGPRPDFVYRTDHGYRAAEARGRSSERPRSTHPNQDQKEKIDKLDEWTEAVKKSGRSIPWSMTWAWITDVATHIDMFRSPAHLPHRRSVAGASTAMAERTAELISEMIEVSTREESEVVDVFDRRARAALRPVGPIRPSGLTEWLAVLIWQERLHQEEMASYESDALHREYPNVMLSEHVAAVLYQAEYGEAPTWEEVTDALRR